MYSALSTLNTTTELPLSKTPNPQLLPGRHSINGYPLLRVCVHGVSVCSLLCVCTLDGLNAEHEFRVWEFRTWPYVTSLSLLINVTVDCKKSILKYIFFHVNFILNRCLPYMLNMYLISK